MYPRPNVLQAENVTLADLTEKQAKFVQEFVARGGGHGAATDAAIAAGYARAGKGGREAARARASELLRHPKILGALRDELTRKLNAGAAIAVETLVDLARNARSEQTRLSAADSLLNRTLGPPISRSANIHANVGIEQLLEQLDAHDRAQTIDGRAREVDDAE